MREKKERLERRIVNIITATDPKKGMPKHGNPGEVNFGLTKDA